MAHYAFLDENNIVTEVIVGVNENEIRYEGDKVVGGSTQAWETYYGNLRGQVCKRTSYNAKHNLVLDPELDDYVEGPAFRKNFAKIGCEYKASVDGFMLPQPYPSWILNEDEGRWLPPVEHPNEKDTLSFIWNEENQTWDAVE